MPLLPILIYGDIFNSPLVPEKYKRKAIDLQRSLEEAKASIEENTKVVRENNKLLRTMGA